MTETYTAKDREEAIELLKAFFTPSQLQTELSKAEKEAARTAHIASQSTNPVLSLAAVQAERRKALVYAATIS